ncbi:MAG: type VI secretion system protein VasJ [Gammaproteobacteria bacterium]
MIKLSEHPLYAIGASPISDEQPCGTSVRYESDFESLEAELAKQESLNAEIVDWDVVADLATKITRESSKDLLVGAYLCYGLLLKDGYTGLAIGLNILNDMLSLHWDCLFPPAKRLRARGTSFTWLSEKAGIYIEAHAPKPGEAEAVMLAAEKLREVDSALVDKMGDQAPMLSELSRPLKNYKQAAEAELAKVEKPAVAANVPEAAPAAESASPLPSTVQSENEATVAAPAAPAPEPVMASPAPVAQVATPATAVATGSLESDADIKKALRQLQSGVRDIASFCIAQKPSDPRAYRFARVSAAMVVEAAPPANAGITQINPPAAERLKFFESLVEKGDHLALITELEKTIARSPFWLDGHFLVVKSLKALGAEFDPAAKTVVRELANLLDRMPELIQLSFSDESPFANDQTRMWLDAEVLAQAGGDSSGGATAASADAWNASLNDARKLAASGESDAAIELINQGVSGASNKREQAYWRCALGELLIQIGKVETAAEMLEQVGEHAKSMKMEEWEPQLLAKVYNLMYQSYQKQQKAKKDDPVFKQKMDQAYSQLCWFDPVTALSVKGG